MLEMPTTSTVTPRTASAFAVWAMVIWENPKIDSGASSTPFLNRMASPGPDAHPDEKHLYPTAQAVG
ncbi:hypothetical protein OH809_15710 [Streptomyces sp. NBC_00873]|uniref:hypothetical protein n=1 Tax=Streptomyces sp. NBC_00873 TaxID=2975852 RepID=UPI003862EFDD|nr:hypothetical protein OH809_15710 [Streptomyces sp. NBC_00873]